MKTHLCILLCAGCSVITCLLYLYFSLQGTVSPLKSCGTQADMSVRLAVSCRETFLKIRTGILPGPKI